LPYCPIALLPRLHSTAQPPQLPALPALFQIDLSSALDMFQRAAAPPALEPQHWAVLALGTGFFAAQSLPLKQGQRVGRKVRTGNAKWAAISKSSRTENVHL